MTTLQQAEARALAAEAEAGRLEERLKEQGEWHRGLQEVQEEGFVQRTADLRVQLDSVHREARAQQTEAARVAGELEAAHAEIADLNAQIAKLKFRSEEPAVIIRWTRDSDPAGHLIGGGVYKGRGPRFDRRPLLVDGRQSGHESTSVATHGEVQKVPASVAKVLSDAGFVVVLGPARLPYRTPLRGVELRTAEQLRNEARALEVAADELEEYDEAAHATPEGSVKG